MHTAGVSPLDSWDYTWGEACEAINGYRERENERSKRKAVALYNATAFLVHSLKTMVTGGDFQSFADAFPGFGGQTDGQGEQKTEMSDEAMYAVVRALNAQFGGKEDP